MLFKKYLLPVMVSMSLISSDLMAQDETAGGVWYTAAQVTM